MNKEPQTGKPYDDEEKALIEAIESDDYELGEDRLTRERLEELKIFAENTIKVERTLISIRIPKTDLSRLKAKALRHGVSYQTYVNSLIHKDVST